MEDLDLTEQAALLSRGEVTPRELIEASIARIDKFEPHYQQSQRGNSNRL